MYPHEVVVAGDDLDFTVRDLVAVVILCGFSISANGSKLTQS
jgi:hypothetical protein